MNILIINHYAGSPSHGMEYRPFYLAREWVRKGHRVSIAAASFSHLRQKNPAMSGSVSEENIEGIRYLWYKTPSYDGNGLGRVANILTFVKRMFSNAAGLARHCSPDVVIASSTYPLDSMPAR